MISKKLNDIETSLVNGWKAYGIFKLFNPLVPEKLAACSLELAEIFLLKAKNDDAIDFATRSMEFYL